jgi:hypothetical protein
MCEPTRCICCCHGSQRDTDGVEQRLGRPRPDRADDDLDLGPHRLDPIEVRRVWPQVDRDRTGRLDHCDHSCVFVGRESGNRPIRSPRASRAGWHRGTQRWRPRAFRTPHLRSTACARLFEAWVQSCRSRPSGQGVCEFTGTRPEIAWQSAPRSLRPRLSPLGPAPTGRLSIPHASRPSFLGRWRLC